MTMVSPTNSAPEAAYFLAESSMPSMTESDLEATRRALDQASSRLRSDGVTVHHLGSAYVSARGRWVCLFAARSGADVRRVSEIAQIMFRSIEEVVAVAGANRVDAAAAKDCAVDS
jgi:hypothetical protein